MALRKVSLDDKYVAESGQVFMTGIQALAVSYTHLTLPTT